MRLAPAESNARLRISRPANAVPAVGPAARIADRARKSGLRTGRTESQADFGTGLELMQIWLGLTHRTHGVHRVLGKVYAASILVATASLDATAGTKPTFALIITS
jgi:hypothetical protein